MSRLVRQHSRGLPSLQESREARQRAIRVGAVRLRAMRPVFWLWAGVVLSVFGVVYWRVSAGQLESQKSGVMAKQRAVRQSLGPRLLPFVERVEALTMELAAADPGSFEKATIEPGIEWEKLARRPGVYLRLLQTKARDVDAIRRSSAVSLNDGFTSCFFIRDGAPDPTQGPACRTSVDCSPGLLCNEWDVCTSVTKPFNMRLAYRAYRILSEDFTRGVQDAPDDLRVRALERELDQITRVDVPVAIDVLQRAKTITIVIDEVPVGMEKSVPFKPGEPTFTDEQRVQGITHEARVAIWDADLNRLVVRWRGSAAGRLLSVGKRVELDAELQGARTRQSNSCMLATSLRSVVQRQAAETRATQSQTSASDMQAPAAVESAPKP